MYLPTYLTYLSNACNPWGNGWTEPEIGGDPFRWDIQTEYLLRRDKKPAPGFWDPTPGKADVGGGGGGEYDDDGAGIGDRGSRRGEEGEEGEGKKKMTGLNVRLS